MSVLEKRVDKLEGQTKDTAQSVRVIIVGVKPGTMEETYMVPADAGGWREATPDEADELARSAVVVVPMKKPYPLA